LPITPTYPGVYIEEVSSGVHPITGVATSITAFVGFAPRGPVNVPTQVQSFTEYIRGFGGLAADSTMSYALNQYFQNGGSQAIVVRAAHLSGGGTLAKVGKLSIGSVAAKTLKLEAANPGIWSAKLLARIDHDTSDPTTLFNLSIKDTATGEIEVFRNLPVDPSIGPIIEAQSQLVRAVNAFPTALPDAHSAIAPGDDPFDPTVATRYSAFPNSGASAGADGDHNETDVVPTTNTGLGVYALARADLFNILVIPPILPSSSAAAGRVLSGASKSSAAQFCLDHRAFFLVDPHPDWKLPSDVTTGGNALTTYIAAIGSDPRRNAAIYFPYLRMADPLTGAPAAFPPAAAIAGVMARTDAARGVWKAPAGLDAGLNGVIELTSKLTDGENGIVNPLGVNALRTFPAAGNVVWGSRTLVGNDALASEWKYVPVRRFALFLEESLYRGTQWVVFEPNDEPLWAQIRLNVGAFMHNLFRQGAFQGITPRDAYLVKCDKETTTQADINNGVVNILVAFAPLKPAEFVVIRIQQLAGQIET
jgi:phage tail sheath protein FI